MGCDCPFPGGLFVLLYILCYKPFPKLHLAHVTLRHLNNWFNVRLISENDSSLFTWYDLVTVLNLRTGKLQQETLKISHFHGRVQTGAGLEFSSFEAHTVSAGGGRKRRLEDHR